MSQGFIILHRKMFEWEWYTDINTKTLFIHILLKANFTDKQWKGINIKRGQFLTSYNTLSNETGLSVQQVRTCIKKLIKTREVTSKATNKYSLLTVEKYNDYQKKQDEATSKTQSSNKQPTSNQQATNIQLTTTNNDNNDLTITKNENKKDIDLFFNSVWELYPNKQGKSAVRETTRNKLAKVGYDNIKIAIERYIKYVENQRQTGFQDLKYLNGSTFFNGRYEDFLDKNYEELKVKPKTLDEILGDV